MGSISSRGFCSFLRRIFKSRPQKEPIERKRIWVERWGDPGSGLNRSWVWRNQKERIFRYCYRISVFSSFVFFNSSKFNSLCFFFFFWLKVSLTVCWTGKINWCKQGQEMEALANLIRVKKREPAISIGSCIGDFIGDSWGSVECGCCRSGAGPATGFSCY